MSIGLHAYLQGYLHEKTAFRGHSMADLMTDPLARALERPGDSFSESAASPITNEDLYRRYGRVPESFAVRSLRPNFANWQPQLEEYRKKQTRELTDRITAKDRAATTGRLQASGRNKGRAGLGGVLRAAADESYRQFTEMGNPFRMGMTALNKGTENYLDRAAGSPARTLKERVNAIMNASRDPRRGYAGTEQDKALSEKMKKRHGAPISYEAEAVRRRDTER